MIITREPKSLQDCCRGMASRPLRAFTLAVGLAMACGGTSDRDHEVAKNPSAAVPWTRREWLAAVDGFLANPATIPRLGDPRFDKLVTTEAWLHVDRTAFTTDADETLRFFPTFKKLTLALAARNAVSELVALGLYGLDVYRAFVAAGSDFTDHLAADDPTRAARQAGIDKIRLGAAIEVCALLYLATTADDTRREAAIAKLADARSYAFHSQDGLQLIVATLDEKLLPGIRANLRAPYQRIRAVVAHEHDGRPATTPAIRTTYQGLAGMDASAHPITIVSTTGGFSVELSPAALVKRVVITQPDGSTIVQHWIELQDGEITFESLCLDGTSESALTATLTSQSGVTRLATQPGTWLALTANGRLTRVRITTIGSRGCLASVEAPAGQFPSTRADAFLASLRPAL
jgi:hypothetical protein